MTIHIYNKFDKSSCNKLNLAGPPSECEGFCYNASGWYMPDGNCYWLDPAGPGNSYNASQTLCQAYPNSLPGGNLPMLFGSNNWQYLQFYTFIKNIQNYWLGAHYFDTTAVNWIDFYWTYGDIFCGKAGYTPNATLNINSQSSDVCVAVGDPAVSPTNWIVDDCTATAYRTVCQFGWCI